MHYLPQSSHRVVRLIFALSTLGLAACGGGGGGGSSTPSDVDTKYGVGGVVSGLSGTLVLQNKESETVTLSSNGAYEFSTKMASGEFYNVEVSQQPVGQICSLPLESYNGSIAGADIGHVDVFCSAASTTISLSGSISSVPFTHIDSDINDPYAAANVSNNNFASAQIIPNFSTVHGFATFAGTGRTQEGDRFATVSDEFDVYRALLQKDQLIQLQVVDYAGLDVFEGDLDLDLYDTGFNLVDSSISVGEFESVRVPSDGDYYIMVSAFDRTSKYTLSLNGVQPLSITNQRSMDFLTGEAVVQFKPAAFSYGFKAANLSAQLNHTDTSRATLARFNDLQAQGVVASQIPSAVMQTLANENIESYRKRQTLQQIKRMSLRDDVAFAEPNYIYRTLLVPNDEQYGLQWHYPAINLPQAWEITTGDRAGSDVIVAVVDTGVFLAHPELSGQLVAGYDFISDAQNARDGDGIDANPDDPGDSSQRGRSSWHGTHVAGTVAAESNNSEGIAGVAWGAKVMPLRVLGAYGGSSYDINQAILFAAGLTNDSGTLPPQIADIINLSLGGGGYSQSAQNTYARVRNAGVLVVAAAGNANSSQLQYPASYDGVVSVSATDFANNRAPYSSYGSRVDVAAPGGSTGADLNGDGRGDGVLSTLVDDSSGTRSPTLKLYQGTSMATPHMAGVLALMRAVHPTLSPDDVDELLSAGTITTDLGAAGRDDIYGHGLIDTLKAVQAAQTLANNGVPPAQPALIVADPTQISFGLNSSTTLNLSNSGGTAASVSNITVDESWLSAAPLSVDADGMGDYNVSVDRSGLGSSSYQGAITFTLSTGGTLVVQVSMLVGVVDNSGNVGTLYMLLLDPNNDVVSQVIPVAQGNGVYSYQFDNVVPGEYRIIGGSDIDNDLYICQMAEMCGGYPTLDSLATINASNVDFTELDFVVDILASFGSGALSVSGGTDDGPTGFSRLPMNTKQLSE